MNSTTSGVIFLQRVTDAEIRNARELRKNMTPAETVLWTALRGGKCNGLKFRRQQLIDGFIADFFCHSAKLVVEVDGEIHNRAEQQKKDAYRRSVFEARGLREIRFTNDEVIRGVDAVVEEIRKNVERKLTSPPLPPLSSQRGGSKRENKAVILTPHL